jgi:hypothetical protein
LILDGWLFVLVLAALEHYAVPGLVRAFLDGLNFGFVAGGHAPFGLGMQEGAHSGFPARFVPAKIAVRGGIFFAKCNEILKRTVVLPVPCEKNHKFACPGPRPPLTCFAAVIFG